MKNVILYVDLFNEIVKQFGYVNTQELARDYEKNKEVYNGYLANEIKSNVLGIYQGTPEAPATYAKILNDIATPAPVVVETPVVEQTTALTKADYEAKTKTELFDILVSLDANTSLTINSNKVNILDEVWRLIEAKNA